MSQTGFPLVSWTWTEYREQIRMTARAFMTLGLQRFGSVSIIGFNSKEWFLSCLAAAWSGATCSGIYTTNGPDASAYVVAHSKSTIVAVEDEKQLTKFLPANHSHDLSHVKAFVLWNHSSTTISSEMIQKFEQQLPNAKIMHWSSLHDNYSAQTPESDLDARAAAIKPTHGASLIYTSGTTGNPKACIISHDNFLYGLRGAIHSMKEDDPSVEMEEMVSYLPLSHIAAQMLDIQAPIFWAAEHLTGFCVTIARPDALKGSLKETLLKVRPTVFFGVPRVFEKFMEAIIAIANKNPITGLKATLVNWAKNAAAEEARAQEVGGYGRGKSLKFWAARYLVLSKIHAALGLDRAWNKCFSGGAPMQGSCLNFFGALGVNIREIWGMSETVGIGVISKDGVRRFTWCGSPVDGSEVCVMRDATRGDPEHHGELCIRGRQVMLGYMNDEAKTREAIDSDGWLHSGDLATIDEFGVVKITGRIKELIIGAGGENIAPIPIEEYIKNNCKIISQCVMVGDKRKYNTILITLRTNTSFESDSVHHELIAPALGFNGSTAKTTFEARECEIIRKEIERVITLYNKQGAVSNAQTIQKFTIIPDDFTMNAGEVTASLKLKRNVIIAKYSNVIDELYGEALPSS
eukprot:GDKJ01013274.1.p1 GENE.GDKJ01013274.1~~GDKJ01013274.1.p1  ORF type:complete len:733 (+),score=161.56 GDKJ01013274.1:303-2201(+)